MSESLLDPQSPLPLYYQVFASLLERIQSGEFPEETSLPSERNLVDEYQVSRGTITKALDMLVDKGLVARRHGRGNFVIGTSPKSGKRSHVIVVIAALDNVYQYSVLTGIARESVKQNCRLNIIGSFDEDDERRYVNEAIHLGASGVITYPDATMRNIALYQQLLSQGIPVVTVDRYFPQLETDRVIFNDEEASYNLTRQLIAKGHKRIAVVTHAEVNTTSVKNRLAGYNRALNEAGISYDEALIWLDLYSSYDPKWDDHQNSSLRFDSLYQHFSQNKPTAVLAINTEVAERLSYDLLAFNENGMRSVIAGSGETSYEKLAVDIAVFSHRQSAGYSVAPSIVAQQPGEWLGEKAVQLLVARLNHEETGPAKTIVVPMRLSESELEQHELFLVSSSNPD